MRTVRLFAGLAALLIICTAAPSLAQEEPAAADDQKIVQEVVQSLGAPIMISPAGVRLIQLMLNRLGYDIDTVDGLWSAETARAMRNFQQARGLEPTGTLTIASINALNLYQLLSGTEFPSPAAADQVLVQEIAVGPGTPVHIGPASIRTIQRMLNRLGYHAGHVTGRWTEDTRQATTNFQQAEGLEPTGTTDIGLVLALGLEQEVFGAGLSRVHRIVGSQIILQETTVGPGIPLLLSPAGVRSVIRALNLRGYDARNVRGIFDETAQRAMRNYQQSQGLEPTGTLTVSALGALGLDGIALSGVHMDLR